MPVKTKSMKRSSREDTTAPKRKPPQPRRPMKSSESASFSDQAENDTRILSDLGLPQHPMKTSAGRVEMRTSHPCEAIQPSPTPGNDPGALTSTNEEDRSFLSDISTEINHNDEYIAQPLHLPTSSPKVGSTKGLLSHPATCSSRKRGLSPQKSTVPQSPPKTNQITRRISTQDFACKPTINPMIYSFATCHGAPTSHFPLAGSSSGFAGLPASSQDHLSYSASHIPNAWNPNFRFQNTPTKYAANPNFVCPPPSHLPFIQDRSSATFIYQNPSVETPPGFNEFRLGLEYESLFFPQQQQQHQQQDPHHDFPQAQAKPTDYQMPYSTMLYSNYDPFGLDTEFNPT